MPASSRAASPCPPSSDDNAGDSLAPAAPCESWSRGSLKAGKQGCVLLGPRDRRFDSCRSEAASRDDRTGRGLFISQCQRRGTD